MKNWNPRGLSLRRWNNRRLDASPAAADGDASSLRGDLLIFAHEKKMREGRNGFVREKGKRLTEQNKQLMIYFFFSRCEAYYQ